MHLVSIWISGDQLNISYGELNPLITHWALALVKGIREPHEVKKKSFDLSENRPTS